MMKWIPLKERLPETNTVVLASFDNGAIDVLLQWGAEGQEPVYADWDNEDNRNAQMRALAWMPLPTPYVEVGVTSN